ncbi:hypothetical protein QTN25_005713 [Entamoeba marina]
MKVTKQSGFFDNNQVIINEIPFVTPEKEDMSKWTLEHIQINVQQGDSSLILIENDADIVKSILIDSGENNGKIDIEKHVLNTLREKLKNQTLDAVIITHWDKDHCGGSTCKILEKIYQKYCNKDKTNFFYSSVFVDGEGKGGDKKMKFADNINNNLKHIGVNGIFAKQLENNKQNQEQHKILIPVSLFDFIDRDTIPNTIDIEFLCADMNYVGLPHEKSKIMGLTYSNENVTEEKDTAYMNKNYKNASSIGILVKYFDKTLLTCGDLGTHGSYYVNKYLNEYLNNEKIDIVKVNHHGASGNNVKDDNTFCFPNFDVALIPYGENSQHGHPNIETIDALIKSIKESANNQNKRIICTNWPHKMRLSDNRKVKWVGLTSIEQQEWSKIKELQKSKKQIEPYCMKRIKYLECANINSNIETTFYYNNGSGYYDINYGDRVLDVDYVDKDIKQSEVISSEYKTYNKIIKTFIKKTSTNEKIWEYVATIDMIQSNEEVNKFNDTIERYGNVVIDCFINGETKKSLSFDGKNETFEDIYYNKEEHQIEVIYNCSDDNKLTFSKKMFNNKEWVELDQVCCEIKKDIIIKLNEKNPYEFLTHENKQCVKFEDIYYNKNNHQIEVIINCSDDNEKIFKRHYFNEDLKFIDQLNIINNKLCYSNENQKRKPIIVSGDHVEFKNIKFDRNTYQFEVDCYFNNRKITVEINQLQEMIEKVIPKDINQLKVIDYEKKGHEIKEFTTLNEYKFEQIVYNKNRERFDIISRVNERGNQKTIQTIFINEKGCDIETIHFNKNEVYIDNNQLISNLKFKDPKSYKDFYYNTNEHRFEVVYSYYENDTKTFEKYFINKNNWEMFETVTCTNKKEIEIYINEKQLQLQTTVPVIPNCTEITYEDIYFNKQDYQFESLYYINNQPNKIFKSTIYSYTTKPLSTQSSSNKPFIKMQFFENQQCILDNTSKNDNSTFECIYYNFDYKRIEVVYKSSNENTFEKKILNEDKWITIEHLSIINNKLCLCNENQKHKHTILSGDHVEFSNIKVDRNRCTFEVGCNEQSISLNQLQEIIGKVILKNDEQLKVINYHKGNIETKNLETSNEYRFEQIVYNKNRERFDIISCVNERGNQKTIQTIFINEKGCDIETIHFNKNEVYIKPSSFNDQITKCIKLNEENELFEDIYYNTNEHRFEMIKSYNNKKEFELMYFNEDKWSIQWKVIKNNETNVCLCLNDNISVEFPSQFKEKLVHYQNVCYNKEKQRIEANFHLEDNNKESNVGVCYYLIDYKLNSNQQYITFHFNYEHNNDTYIGNKLIKVIEYYKDNSLVKRVCNYKEINENTTLHVIETIPINSDDLIVENFTYDQVNQNIIYCQHHVKENNNLQARVYIVFNVISIDIPTLSYDQKNKRLIAEYCEEKTQRKTCVYYDIYLLKVEINEKGSQELYKLVEKEWEKK